MTRYTVDGVAMVHYLLDTLPPAANQAFTRAEEGIDVLEAPPIAISEALWAAVRKGEADNGAGPAPKTVLDGLVSDGPIRVAPTDERDLAVLCSLLDHHALHDAHLLASHRVRDTEAIVSNDEGFQNDVTIWD